MKKVVPFISLFFIVSSFFLFFALRQTPKGELWQGYSVLYVSVDTSDDDVTTVLNQFGISNFTCLSNQYLPTVLSPDSVEVSLLSFNTPAFDYLAKRNNYFFDKSHDYKLYYIPIEYKPKLTSCVNYLNKNNVFSGVDSVTKYPILLPICVFVFAIILFLFSKNKMLFVFSAVQSVFFSVCFPYLSCVASSIILLLILFVSSNIYKRRGAVEILLRKIIFIVLIIVSIASAFTATIISGLMFILLLISTVFSYLLFDFCANNFTKKTSFNPVLIRSAKLIPQFAGKEKIVLPVSVFLVFIVFAVSVFSIDSLSLSDSSISLPSSNVAINSENLPDLDEYAKWDFIFKSYPYRSVNQNNEDLLAPVSFFRYSTTGRNVIESQEMLSFNSDFIDNSVNQIDSLNYNAIEKILKSQDSNFVFGYSVSGSQTLSLFSIIFVIAQFLCLSIFYIKTVFKKHRGNR